MHNILDRTLENANEMQLLQRLQKFQTVLIHALSEGYKQPRIPTWWTSFEEGTYKDFVAQYKKKVYHRHNIIFIY